MSLGSVAYCERLLHEVEPVNVATNVAFLLVGWHALRAARGTRTGRGTATGTGPGTDRAHAGLALLAIAVGLGSASFHLAPNVATHLADLLPIALFVALSTIVVLVRVHRVGTPSIVAALSLWLGATVIASRYPDSLAGSGLYLPLLVLLGVLAATAPAGRIGARRSVRPRAAILAILIAFAFALAMRALDLTLCDSTSRGTHGLWHAGTALVAALVLRLVRASGPPELRRSAAR